MSLGIVEPQLPKDLYIKTLYDELISGAQAAQDGGVGLVGHKNIVIKAVAKCQHLNASISAMGPFPLHQM